MNFSVESNGWSGWRLCQNLNGLALKKAYRQNRSECSYTYSQVMHTHGWLSLLGTVKGEHTRLLQQTKNGNTPQRTGRAYYPSRGDSMIAGAFLDALVAQKVFGFPILGFTECQVGWTSYAWEAVPGSLDSWVQIRPVYLGYCTCDIWRGCTYERTFGHCDECLAVIPEYSANLNAAFRVMKSFPCFELSKDGDEWIAMASGRRVKASTAPLAICLAVL